MMVCYLYQKSRDVFGRQCSFNDVPATMVQMTPSATAQEKTVALGNCHLTWDSSNKLAESGIATQPVLRSNKGMSHTEGGWPDEIDMDDEAATKRFRKRREKGAKVKGNQPQVEPLGSTVKRLGPVVQLGVKQNNTINIYENYFDDALVDHSSEPPSAKGMAVLRDPSPVQRTATCIDWYQDGPTRIAVAYAIGKFQDPRLMQKTLPVRSYIWDVQKPNSPESSVLPTSPLLSLRFNPKNPETLIGGSYNGLVSFFDRRKKETPCASSIIKTSHHDPVYDVRWTQSKTGTLCCSNSTDGQLLWWDTRRLSEPFDLVCIKDEKGRVYGASCMAYNPEAGPHKYLVGTEQGMVANVNARNKKVNGGVSMSSAGPGKHHSPIYAIERNPFHPKYFMTVGDWTARVWTEELKSPIMTTRYHNSYVTAGCWSPTRPGVFLVTRKDGIMDCWDYFSKQNEVAFSYKVSDSPLSSIAVSRGGTPQMVAVGDECGTVSLFELSDSLSVRQNNEKQAMAGMFQREMLRERNLIASEKDAKRHRDRSGKADGDEKDSKKNADEEETLMQIEANFLDLIDGQDSADTKK